MNFLRSSITFGRYPTIIQRTFRRNYQNLPGYQHLFKQFNSTYPEIRKFLVNKVKQDWAKKQYSEMLDHQLSAGRQLRSAIVLKVNEVMSSTATSDVKSEGLQRIHVIGWIVDMQHAASLLADDMMEESKLRRGQIPWYLKRGKFASTDLLMATLTPYFLLNEWFEKDPFYHSAANILQKHCFESAIIQMADSKISECFKNRELSWEKYREYLVLKTFYALELSFKFSAFESTKSDLQFDERTNRILEDLGSLLQLSNDGVNIVPRNEHFLNSKDFDEDIKSGQVNFAVTYLMNNATQEDKDSLLENNGKNERKCIDEVRRLYDKYDVPNELLKFIENLNKIVSENIKMVSNEHGLQDGLLATQETLKFYMKCDPGEKNAYPNVQN